MKRAKWKSKTQWLNSYVSFSRIIYNSHDAAGTCQIVTHPPCVFLPPSYSNHENVACVFKFTRNEMQIMLADWITRQTRIWKTGRKLVKVPFVCIFWHLANIFLPYKQLVRCVRSFLRDLSPLSPRNHKENKMLPLEGILRQATGQEAFQ